MIRLRISSIVCVNCGRGAVVGYNRPKSLHRTKRVVKVNLQKVNGQRLCTRCLRTMTRKPRPTAG